LRPDQKYQKWQAQQMTTDLRLQSLISDKDSSNICHLRPKNGSSNCGRAFGSWLLAFWRPGDGVKSAPQNAAKLQLEVVVFPAGSQSRFSPILFMKNEDNTSGAGKVENSGASWAKNFH